MKSLLLFLLVAPILCSATTGSIHVTGHLLCHDQPYRRETVRIYEYNKIESDGYWGEVTTDDSGYFSLKMTGSDWFSVSPYLWIPNYCAATIIDTTQCTESCIKIEIPEQYISEGHIPKLKFDVGNLELLDMEFGQQPSLFKVIFGYAKECRERL